LRNQDLLDPSLVMASDQEREHALASFKQKLIESREWEAKLKALRLDIKGLQKEFDQTEDNIKALQSVGQIIGEVLKQLDDERCTSGRLDSDHLRIEKTNDTLSYFQSS
jgi:ATP-dependent 26S proteasome regulatory subunit